MSLLVVLGIGAKSNINVANKYIFSVAEMVGKCKYTNMQVKLKQKYPRMQIRKYADRIDQRQDPRK